MALSHWIKERDNPQTGIYFIPKGQLTVKEAESMENTLYGFNTMHRYKTEKEYLEAIEVLKSRGCKIL